MGVKKGILNVHKAYSVPWIVFESHLHFTFLIETILQPFHDKRLVSEILLCYFQNCDIWGLIYKLVSLLQLNCFLLTHLIYLIVFMYLKWNRLMLYIICVFKSLIINSVTVPTTLAKANSPSCIWLWPCCWCTSAEESYEGFR